MEIPLGPELMTVIADQARRQGTTPELLAADCLRERFIGPHAWRPTPASGESLADFLRDYLGVLASSEHVPGGAGMSDSNGQKFAEALLAKRRQGKL